MPLKNLKNLKTKTILRFFGFASYGFCPYNRNERSPWETPFIFLVWGRALHFLLLIFEDAKEYCHNEQFVAKCPDNDLILITSAMYGRMRVGKCVKEGFGYLECYADVTRHIHERCSGRPSCAIRVPDATLDGTKPCNEDLKSYLDVNFTCIKGKLESIITLIE